MDKKISNWVKGLLSVWVIILSGTGCFAQSAQLTEARVLVADKQYDKAINIYKELYDQSPDSVYIEYIGALSEAKKYKLAEQIIERQMSISPQNDLLHIDLGVIYSDERKENKAKEQFEHLLQLITGDDIVTQRIVKAFTNAGRNDYAILAYEKEIKITGNANAYSEPLAKLYAGSGQLDKAVDILFAGKPGQFINVESAKALLLEILGDNPEKLQLTQKILIKKINEQPDNVYYAELLTWIYTQKNDWDGALIQIEAIDARNQESGKRLIDFARTAAAAKQYGIAGKAYDDVIAKGSSSPLYPIAKSERIATAFTNLKNDSAYTTQAVNDLIVLYDSLFIESPQSYSTQAAADYAMLVALYGHDVPKGIEILKTAISQPDTRKNIAGTFKLQMGDYYLLIGKIWDASLTYSQVDKDFKQDVLGEDARFRNAKLAYYRGDFVWAQRQLSILKASTTELIANDALYLSVLITENVEDSNYVPLQRFAYADLLLFQNKDQEAESLLDSINHAFPKHPLNDDIIMQRSKIAEKHHDYIKAIAYLKTIYEQYSQDVLGDDAVFKMAEIYQNHLNQPDAAKHYYEQLVIDYPGSTYVQTARQRLSDMNKITPNP